MRRMSVMAETEYGVLMAFEKPKGNMINLSNNTFRLHRATNVLNSTFHPDVLKIMMQETIVNAEGVGVAYQFRFSHFPRVPEIYERELHVSATKDDKRQTILYLREGPRLLTCLDHTFFRWFAHFLSRDIPELRIPRN